MNFKSLPQLDVTLDDDTTPDAQGNPGYILRVKLGPWADDAVPESGRKVKLGLVTPMKMEKMESSPEVQIEEPKKPNVEGAMWGAIFEMSALKDADSQVVQIKLYRLSPELRSGIMYIVRDKDSNKELGLGDLLFDFPK